VISAAGHASLPSLHCRCSKLLKQLWPRCTDQRQGVLMQRCRFGCMQAIKKQDERPPRPRQKTTKLPMSRCSGWAALQLPQCRQIAAAVAHHVWQAAAMLAGRCVPVWGCWDQSGGGEIGCERMCERVSVRVSVTGSRTRARHLAGL